MLTTAFFNGCDGSILKNCICFLLRYVILSHYYNCDYIVGYSCAYVGKGQGGLCQVELDVVQF